MSRVVCVTGVAGAFAARVARALAEDEGHVGRVVGVDTRPPEGDLGGVKFVRADIRTPVVGKVLAVEDVDAVVHLDVNPPERSRGGSGAKERNVIGSMQLLAACQRSSTVRTLVLGSSTAVYGTSPRDPAKFTESLQARGGVHSGFGKDVVEIEGYVRGLARRRPEIIITTLRMAQLLDARVDSSLRSYLSNPLLPTALGYDPRLQVLHLDDAIGVISASIRHDRPGTFNVAGDGVLLLSQMARRLGRPTIPLPPIGFGSAARRVVSGMGGQISPDLHRLLTFGRVVDCAALREIFGYDPRYSTEETFEGFRAGMPPGLLAGARAG